MGYDECGEIPGLAIPPSGIDIPARTYGPASSFTVTTTNDTGAGSLRKAITDANANPGLDYITFNVGPPGNLVSIFPNSPLPTITSPVVIDGTTQPGYSGHPHVEIRGDLIAVLGNGLTVGPTAAGSTIRGIGVSYFLGQGIEIDASNTVIEGCWIGFGITNVGLGNLYSGILILNASNCRIGGTVDTTRNVVTANGNFGIYVLGLASNNVIQGNYVGLDPSGTFALGNTYDGVRLNVYGGNGASSNIVGGTAPGSRNIISGNDSAGIGLYGGSVTNNRIIGNYIGTNPAGTQAIPNGREGIRFWNFSSQSTGTAFHNIVGGPTPAEWNVISGNTKGGIAFVGGPSGGNDNLIIGNIIGLNATASAPLGNGADGISIKLPYGGTIRGTQIGGSTPDSGNFICSNHGVGVSLSGSGVSQTRIRRNSIFANDSLGIDLGANRVTPNDSLDSDGGPNELQNFPIIDSVVVTSSSTKIFGRLDAKPNQRYTVDFYTSESADALHFGEGKTFFVEDPAVVCDNTGRRQFQEIVSVPLPANTFVTATATDSLGNTSEFSQAFSPADQDSDGIYDMWETQGWGMDVNSDGKIDQDLFAMGARPDHKDIFVEVDAMAGMVPQGASLDSVVAAFAKAPNNLVQNPDGQNGIKLHCILDDTTIPQAPWPTNWWDSFDAAKTLYFGSKPQRDSSNARNILQAKNLVFRYCIFAHSGNGDDGGSAELAEGSGGNDFMVTLGLYRTSPGTLDQQAGTFMHELGHTLGLRHGGGDNTLFKPNYYSVMNYMWVTERDWQSPGSWKLDYSRVTLPRLVKYDLNETIGLNPRPGDYDITPIPFNDGEGNLHWAKLAPGTAVDWDGNGDSTSVSVGADINYLVVYPGSADILYGFTDWSHLVYNFRNSPNFAPGVHTQLLSLLGEEISQTLSDSLDSFPPPRPAGYFIMDGQLDPSATLISSNGGINLFATMHGSQLYVATNSAQSQNADIFIFIAVVPGTMTNPPWGKAGQVAAWSAVLANESTDNSAVWYDLTSRDLFAISTDTAGTILEGVVDLEYLTGVSPPTVYLAVGKYQTGNAGVLLAQAPAGNGDGDINANEFIGLETALPIQLASFTARAVAGGHVQVEWTTLSEINNFGFEVQRKRVDEPQFMSIPHSFIAGHGTSSEPHHYSFVDTTVTPGNWRYRLKQIDLDGTTNVRTRGHGRVVDGGGREVDPNGVCTPSELSQSLQSCHHHQI